VRCYVQRLVTTSLSATLTLAPDDIKSFRNKTNTLDIDPMLDSIKKVGVAVHDTTPFDEHRRLILHANGALDDVGCVVELVTFPMLSPLKQVSLPFPRTQQWLP
jgi:hypothetical protein